MSNIPSREAVKARKERYPKGTRVRLLSMDDPWTPVPAGSEGTVDCVDDIGTIHVRWDSGRMLGICPEGGDLFEVIGQ